jgi:hypothetical protein
MFFSGKNELLREKKQLKVINYEIIPWQCDVRSNYTNYCFHLSFINPGSFSLSSAPWRIRGHVMGF